MILIFKFFPQNFEVSKYKACYIHHQSFINSITPIIFGKAPSYTNSPDSSLLKSTLF